MPAEKLYCTECGAVLPGDARFCEMCGAHVDSVHDPLAESVIGHLPAESVEEGKGLFGRTKYTQINLVVTTHRLLCLHETNEMNENWLAEGDRLLEEEERTGRDPRAIIDSYDWSNPLWASFYETQPADLLAAHRGNRAIPVADIVSAAITLDEELDKLDIQLTSGQLLRFRLYYLVGQAAARFLTQALGPERLQLTPQGS